MAGVERLTHLFLMVAIFSPDVLPVAGSPMYREMGTVSSGDLCRIGIWISPFQLARPTTLTCVGTGSCVLVRGVLPRVLHRHRISCETLVRMPFPVRRCVPER